MSIYALWNNKGGVGKSYLTFQIACEYARIHRETRVLVVDMCPQANSSSMLLGGIVVGEQKLDELSSVNPKRTISGYVEERIRSPYVSPNVGGNYAIRVNEINSHIPDNLYLVVGDEELEVQASRVSNAAIPGPTDAWRIVHSWISDIISDIRTSWNVADCAVFIDCNPSFTIYTELALSASDRLIIPFSADGSSKRAVRAVLALVYGITRHAGMAQSEFYLNSTRFRMSTPRIYSYVGNRLTQMNRGSAGAFKTVVNEIGGEIWQVWRTHTDSFSIHPTGAGAPSNRADFKKMFQAEINDANTASVVSGALGIPISALHSGQKNLSGRMIMVNQSQLDSQQPNLRQFVGTIE
jgi:cellulose biosynthesis protein BcsQ